MSRMSGFSYRGLRVVNVQLCSGLGDLPTGAPVRTIVEQHLIPVPEVVEWHAPALVWDVCFPGDLPFVSFFCVADAINYARHCMSPRGIVSVRLVW